MLILHSFIGPLTSKPFDLAFGNKCFVEIYSSLEDKNEKNNNSCSTHHSSDLSFQKENLYWEERAISYKNRSSCIPLSTDKIVVFWLKWSGLVSCQNNFFLISFSHCFDEYYSMLRCSFAYEWIETLNEKLEQEDF